MDEETEQLLAADFEIGHFFRDRIIPRAVLYFTGEALEEDDDYDEEEEDEDGEKMTSGGCRGGGCCGGAASDMARRAKCKV